MNLSARANGAVCGGNVYVGGGAGRAQGRKKGWTINELTNKERNRKESVKVTSRVSSWRYR